MFNSGKAIAFIDEANLRGHQNRLGVRIDYKKLLAYLESNYQLLRAYAYTGVDLETRKNFIYYLKRSGFRVVNYRTAAREDGTYKSNVDVYLAVDMVAMSERYDICILFSGDGDYVPAVEAISRKGIRVELISLEERTASDLIDIVDKFIELKELIVTEDILEEQDKQNDNTAEDEMVENKPGEHQAIVIMYEIFSSIPTRMYPLSTNIIIRRANELDVEEIIHQTRYGSYSKLLDSLTAESIIQIGINGEDKFVEGVNLDALEHLLYGNL